MGHGRDDLGASSSLQRLQEKMTAKQIAEAARLVVEWKPKKLHRLTIDPRHAVLRPTKRKRRRSKQVAQRGR